MKIRAGDSVVIISGKDKGKTGQVLRVLHEKNRVVVSDVNMRTRHMRASANRPGEIVKYEAALHASNVMVLDPKTKKPTRIGYKIEKGKKTRIAKKSGEEIKKTVVTMKKKESVKGDKGNQRVQGVQGSPVSPDSPVSPVSSVSPSKKSPFWKKMGFGAEEQADIVGRDQGSHMKEDHSVPDQVERSSTRGSQRGS